jgi:hypothetical protein
MSDVGLANCMRGKPKVADKAALRRILEEQDRLNGFVVDPMATPQKAREMMIAQGIRPENNAFSCEIRSLQAGAFAG